jgi:hypothetical protein
MIDWWNIEMSLISFLRRAWLSARLLNPGATAQSLKEM